MKLYATLHSHSTHSDGVYTPTELVQVAKNEGYKAIALTDHDVASGAPEMRKACAEEGLEYLFGCEFSSPWKAKGIDFHITAYHFDPEYGPVFSRLAAQEREHCLVVLEILGRLKQ